MARISGGSTAIIVYAHKSEAGWETLINALLNSGLVITSAWAISTEMKSSLVKLNAANLLSSIYIAARKIEREEFGLYGEVRAELKIYLKKRLLELWESGVSGADLFIAAIGNALQVFGKYEEVIDDDDKTIRADRMLEDIQEIIADYAVERVGAEATPLTRFYLVWRQEYGEKRIAFDLANQLARSFHIELTEKFGQTSFVQRDQMFVRLLGPHERELDDFFDSRELINILHHSLLLWRSGKREEMVRCLAERSVGLDELIWNVAQAVSVSLSLEAEERKWLEGWLADRESIKRDVTEVVEDVNQGELIGSQNRTMET